MKNDLTPNLAKGTQIPESAAMYIMDKEERKAERNREFRHDWLIALFSSISGGIVGFLASLVFWLLTK